MENERGNKQLQIDKLKERIVALEGGAANEAPTIEDIQGLSARLTATEGRLKALETADA